MYDIKRKLTSVGYKFCIESFDILYSQKDSQETIGNIKRNHLQTNHMIYTDKSYKSRVGHFNSLCKHGEIEDALKIISESKVANEIKIKARKILAFITNKQA